MRYFNLLAVAVFICQLTLNIKCDCVQMGFKNCTKTIAISRFLYPLNPEVLKVEYMKPQNFKYGTTVE